MPGPPTASQTSLVTAGLFEASGTAESVLTPGTWTGSLESSRAESGFFVGFSVFEPVRYSLSGLLSGAGGYIQLQFLDTDINLQISDTIALELSGRLEPGDYTFMVATNTISLSGNTPVNDQAAYDLSMTLIAVPLPAAAQGGMLAAHKFV